MLETDPAAHNLGLLRRWVGLAGPEAAAAGLSLLARYNEPHRKYHTTEHLVAVLDAIDVLADCAEDPDAVRFAAWFHDSVYATAPAPDTGSAAQDPHSPDAPNPPPASTEPPATNEESSARLAESVLPALGVPAARTAEAARLVRLTERHDPAPDDRNGAVLCDADLAVLGRDPEGYQRYRDQVRAEYAAVPWDLFRLGRAQILRALLAAPHLYRTEAAYERFEASARANLAAELLDLDPDGPQPQP